MISAIIAGVTAAASIAGGIAKSRMARKEAREEAAQVQRQRAENAAYFNRFYNADATQLADNRRLLTEASGRLRRENQAASGRNAVMGGTNASAAATKEANSKAYADAVSQISANAQAQKQHVQDTYMKQNSALDSQELAARRLRSEANQAAVDTAVQGVNSVAQAYVAGNSKKV